MSEVREVFGDREVVAFAGGLDLTHASEGEVRALAGFLRDEGMGRFLIGHCTEDAAVGVLKEELPGRVDTLAPDKRFALGI